MKEYKTLNFKADVPSEEVDSKLNMEAAGGFEVESFQRHPCGTMFLMSKKSKAVGDTAFPSEKQMGYIAWSYNIDETELKRLKVTRKEASSLISDHQEAQRGIPYKRGHLKECLRALREPSGEEYDADLPF